MNKDSPTDYPLDNLGSKLLEILMAVTDIQLVNHLLKAVSLAISEGSYNRRTHLLRLSGHAVRMITLHSSLFDPESNHHDLENGYLGWLWGFRVKENFGKSMDFEFEEIQKPKTPQDSPRAQVEAILKDLGIPPELLSGDEIFRGASKALSHLQAAVRKLP